MRRADFDAIRQGNWNIYVIERRKQPYVPDLAGADLAGADLAHANLRRANLAGADLAGANLRMANLAGANLNRANVSGAYLRQADLAGANLRMANLAQSILLSANLRGADLTGANLTGADLRGVDLSQVVLSPAQLAGVHLNYTAVPSPVDEPPAVLGVFVEISTYVGSWADPQEIVDLVRAVGVMANLAVAVGPRIYPEQGAWGSGSTATLTTTTTEGHGNEIHFSSLEYRNPFMVEMVEALKIAVPTAGILGAAVGAGRVTMKDLAKGPDKSGLVAFLAILMSPEERSEFFEGRVARRRRQRIEDEAGIAEAQARITKIQVAPTAPHQLADRVRDAVGDTQAADAAIECLPELAPLTSRPYTVSVSGDEPKVTPH